MYAGKPVIGIVGGIGSGKSFVADLFGELGGLVIKSDEQVRQAYEMAEVRQQIRSWWGDGVFHPNGEVDRQAIAARVFRDAGERKRLEQLIHPMVGRLRDELMLAHATEAAVKAFIWDTPLLYEVGLDQGCDAVVFVDAPVEIRLERVRRTRDWSREELLRREISQLPLDKKREMAQYMVVNTGDAVSARSQVAAVLSRILAKR